MGWSGRAPAPPAKEAGKGTKDEGHAMSATCSLSRNVTPSPLFFDRRRSWRHRAKCLQFHRFLRLMPNKFHTIISSAVTSRSHQLPIAHSGTRHVPDLLELRARIANHFGDRAEATKISLYLFHIGLARVRCYINDKTDFWKWHFDFFKQLRAATVESRLGANCHRLEFDAVFLRALVGDDISAGDQCSHHRFGWRWAHICAFALFGLTDDRLDVAYGNFRARMGGTVTSNPLRDGGLLFHSNHNIAPVVSLGG